MLQILDKVFGAFLSLFMVSLLVGIGAVGMYAYMDGKAYTPCWSTLGDVMLESMHQEELGWDGWDFDNPDLFNSNCVLVNPDEPWRGYRQLTRDEHLDLVVEEYRNGQEGTR